MQLTRYLLAFVRRRHIPGKLDIGLPYSTGVVVSRNPGMLTRMWEGLGFTGKLKYKKILLRRAAMRLYLCCAELVDHDQMMTELRMPDTFNSWFRITELHIWMSMVRLANEGREGKFVRNNLVHNMWQDSEQRTKKLGDEAAASVRRRGLQEIGEQFKSSLYSYDEGLMSDDIVLAGSLWRNFFQYNCHDACHLEIMVEYVRKQIPHIEKQETNEILTRGILNFLPFIDCQDEDQRRKFVIKEILKRT